MNSRRTCVKLAKYNTGLYSIGSLTGTELNRVLSFMVVIERWYYILLFSLDSAEAIIQLKLQCMTWWLIIHVPTSFNPNRIEAG